MKKPKHCLIIDMAMEQDENGRDLGDRGLRFDYIASWTTFDDDTKEFVKYTREEMLQLIEEDCPIYTSAWLSYSDTHNFGIDGFRLGVNDQGHIQLLGTDAVTTMCIRDKALDTALHIRKVLESDISKEAKFVYIHLIVNPVQCLKSRHYMRLSVSAAQGGCDKSMKELAENGFIELLNAPGKGGGRDHFSYHFVDLSAIPHLNCEDSRRIIKATFENVQIMIISAIKWNRNTGCLEKVKAWTDVNESPRVYSAKELTSLLYFGQQNLKVYIGSRRKKNGKIRPEYEVSLYAGRISIRSTWRMLSLGPLLGSITRPKNDRPSETIPTDVWDRFNRAVLRYGFQEGRIRYNAGQDCDRQCAKCLGFDARKYDYLCSERQNTEE